MVEFEISVMQIKTTGLDFSGSVIALRNVDQNSYHVLLFFPNNSGDTDNIASFLSWCRSQ